MINKDNIIADFWKAISVHYDKECYDDVLKDACFYLIDLIQNKSENYDQDGEKLINTVFSEKNPKLLINKNQTESEKDEQRGYYYFVRGLICAIRNPLSHTKKIKFSKTEVDSIILFMNNYIIPKLDDTKDFGYVDNWFDFIFISNNNDSKRFSDKILENMKKKDKYNLLIEIIEKLQDIKKSKYSYFINELFNNLTKKNQDEIYVLLNRRLINAQDDQYLRMFFDHFSPSIWNKLDELVRVRIEDMVFQSIEKAQMSINPKTGNESVSSDGSLSTWTVKWVPLFDNYIEIKDFLFEKMKKESEGEFVINYYLEILENDDQYLLNKSDEIIKELKKGNNNFKYLLDDYYIFEKKPEFNIFDEAYASFVAKNEEEDLPF